MQKIFFVVLFSLVFIADIIMGILAARRRNRRSVTLAVCIFSVALVTFSYMMSVVETNIPGALIMSSFYFIATDLMTLSLCLYSYSLTTRSFHIETFAPVLLIFAFGAADIAIMAGNPWTGLVLTIRDTGEGVVHWEYIHHFWHYMHYTFNYLVALIVMGMFLFMALKVASIYKRKYWNAFFGIALVIVLKTVYIFTNVTMFDISILGYSGLALFYLVSDSGASWNNMVRQASGMILDDIGHPVILFDDKDLFAMCNKDGEAFIPEEKRVSEYSLHNFIEDNNIDPEYEFALDDSAFQWSDTSKGAYRCDLHILKDEKGTLIGRLFTLVENSLEKDLLTSFMTKAAAQKTFDQDDVRLYYPLALLAFDINRLTDINKDYEMSGGDKAIKALADIIRKSVPENSYLLRLEDAVLAAVCQDMDMHKARELSESILNEFAASDILPVSLSAQSAVSVAISGETTVHMCVNEAMSSLRLKKLLDPGSAHSSLLDSLAATQMAGSLETREHIKRTQEMGEKLGRRLELSDNELNSLALLNLLHDIGQVGIPAEILYKPGKLDAEEWKLMKTHVEKGSTIARASKELSGIADCILYHHEAFDGSGYPLGLVGVSIPLLSRINAVIDTFDAITHDRPYRPAQSIAAAVMELKAGAGTQFDPAIVAEFIELLAELYGDEVVDAEYEPITVRPVIHGNDVPVTPVAPRGNIYPLNFARYTLDKDHKVISINPAFTELTGYTYGDLETYSLHQADLLPVEDKDDYLAVVAGLLSTQDAAFAEHRIRSKNGSVRNVMCCAREYFDPDAEENRTELIFVDVSDSNVFRMHLEKSQEAARENISRMEEMIRQDGQTGLFLRRSFKSEVDNILLSRKLRVVLIMMDIDDFKKYNDTCGHSYGDDVIRAVAAALKECLEEGEFAARVGGDEFAVCLRVKPDMPKDSVEALIRSRYTAILSMIQQEFPMVTLSCGAGVSSEERYTFKMVYDAADEAMYEIKKSGKNGLKCNLD